MCCLAIEFVGSDVWVGTKTGVAKFDGKDWLDYTPKDIVGNESDFTSIKLIKTAISGLQL